MVRSSQEHHTINSRHEYKPIGRNYSFVPQREFQVWCGPESLARLLFWRWLYVCVGQDESNATLTWKSFIFHPSVLLVEEEQVATEGDWSLSINEGFRLRSGIHQWDRETQRGDAWMPSRRWVLGREFARSVLAAMWVLDVNGGVVLKRPGYSGRTTKSVSHGERIPFWTWINNHCFFAS